MSATYESILESRPFGFSLEGLKNLCYYLKGSPTEDPHEWVEELMILYNKEAAKLLRPIIKTKPVGHIGQYILLKLSSGTRSPAGDFYIYLSTLNYQLMQRSITAGVPEPFIVPITTSSSTVVPNTKIYFPLLFISQKKINNNNIFPKFSFTNHPGKQQLVYTVTREFQIQHPKNSRPPRLSSDKKSVFLTREIVAKNLEPIAKTVPISLL